MPTQECVICSKFFYTKTIGCVCSFGCRKEKIQLYSKKYYQEKKEKIQLRDKKYSQENKEKRQLYRHENKEKIQLRDKKYYQENKEKRQLYRHKKKEKENFINLIKLSQMGATNERN